MSAPHPDRLARQVEAVKQTLADADLVGAYRWLYYAGLGQTSGSGAKVRAGMSDPTALAATSEGRERARAAAARVAQLVREASKALSAADTILDRSMNGGSRQTGNAGRVFPRTVTDDDLEAAREAKARREGRGEGWGEG